MQIVKAIGLSACLYLLRVTGNSRVSEFLRAVAKEPSPNPAHKNIQWYKLAPSDHEESQS